MMCPNVLKMLANIGGDDVKDIRTMLIGCITFDSAITEKKEGIGCPGE